MRIEQAEKLDYSDVLIRPKRSTLGSRKEVSLERRFTFRNYKPKDMSMEILRPESNPHYKGIPIMASNMDGVGMEAQACILLIALLPHLLWLLLEELL